MFRAIFKPTHYLLFLVLSCFQLVTALVTFRINEQYYSYATQDPFGVNVPAYFSTGTLVLARFDKTSPCTLTFPETNLTDPNLNSTLDGHGNATDVVLAVNLATAQRSGCSTITHIGIAAYNLQQSMEKNTGPRFNAVLLLLYPTPGSTPGPPSELPYTTYASTFPNGAPPINMALLPAGNILDKLASNNTITSPIITYLQEEPGPWNEAYFSTERMVFVYTLVFINVFVGVREFIRFLWKKRSWDNWTRTHHIMFWLAVVSSILCTLTLILSPVSPTYIWIQTPLSILIGTAFHMFLICWCRVIARIENSRIVVAIYYILWPFYLFSVTMLIMHRIFSIMPYSPRSMIVFNISYYATSGMQVVWIVTFFYYIYIFWSKSRMGGINKATRKLLFQIVRVCSIFVTGIIVGLIANELIRGKIWRQSVASDTARSLLSQVSITIRTVAMILALDTDSDETKEKKRNIHIHRYNNNNNNNNNASPANANFVMLTSNLPNSPHSPHALKSSFVRISALMPERDDDDDIETHEV